MSGPPTVTFSTSDTTAYFDCLVAAAPAETQGSIQYSLSWTSAGSVLSQVTLTSVLVDRLALTDLTQDQQTSVLDNGVCFSFIFTYTNHT